MYQIFLKDQNLNFAMFSYRLHIAIHHYNSTFISYDFQQLM